MFSDNNEVEEFGHNWLLTRPDFLWKQDEETANVLEKYVDISVNYIEKRCKYTLYIN